MPKAKQEQRRSRWWELPVNGMLWHKCSVFFEWDVFLKHCYCRTGCFLQGDGSGVRLGHQLLPRSFPSCCSDQRCGGGAPWWVFQERRFLTGWGKAGQRQNSWSYLGNRWGQWKIHLVKSGLKSTQKLSQLLGLGRQSMQCLKALLPFFLPHCLPPFFSFLSSFLPFFFLFLFLPFFFLLPLVPLPPFFPLYVSLPSSFLVLCSF